MSENLRGASVVMMNRIFKKHFSKQVQRWKFRANPERQAEYVEREYKQTSPERYEFVARLGAAQILSKLQDHILYKEKVRSFRALNTFANRKRIEMEQDESITERVGLLERQNILMEELRAYKNETETLNHELDDKEKNLRDAMELNTILSLRINYMITQKFLNLIDKVFESVEYRQMNDAYDALIDEANENFEREEMFIDEDF